MKHVLGVSAPPAIACVAASCGSSLAMLACTFKVTSMPWECAHARNEAGSGKSEAFHSQPSQLFGDFQSVSTDRSSSGTLFARNCGISVFS